MNAPLASGGASVPFERRFVGAYPGAGETAISGFVRYALAVLWRHRLLGLAIVSAIVLATITYTALQTPLYTATATVQINDQEDQVLGQDLESDPVGPSDWDIDRFLNTQLELLRSRALAERVVNELNVPADPAMLAAIGMDGAIQGNDTEHVRARAVQALQGALIIDLPRDNRVARIGFTSGDPGISARIANAFAEQFIQSALQRRYDSSSYARDFVATRLEQARVDLEDSERRLNEYARSAGLLRSGPRGSTDGAGGGETSVTTSSLMQLNDAAIAARADRIAQQARWNAVQATPLLASQAELSNPTIQSLMNRQAAIEADLEAARARYLPDHPTVGRLRADLAAVGSQLNQAARNVRTAIQSEYRASVTAQAGLDRQVSNMRGATLAEQDRSVRYNTLTREADTARSIYDGLLQRFRELNASAGITASNISIIDRASVPASPSSPNLGRNTLIALLLGSVIALGTVFLRDQLDDVIHVPEDVEEKLDMALLGIIPRSPTGSPIVDLANPRSPLAEAYNSLRGSLIYATPQGAPRLMAITSAQAGEGKSTTSLAAADGFARLGMNVLLIDADLRRPAIHKLTAVDGERGLTDVLTSRRTLDEVVQRGDMAFDVLPSGPVPPSPTELVGSPRMAPVAGGMQPPIRHRYHRLSAGAGVGRRADDRRNRGWDDLCRGGRTRT